MKNFKRLRIKSASQNPALFEAGPFPGVVFAKLLAEVGGPAQVSGGLAPFPGTTPASWEVWQVKPQPPLPSSGNNSPISKGCCKGNRRGACQDLCSVPDKQGAMIIKRGARVVPCLRAQASQTLKNKKNRVLLTEREE